MTRDLHERAVEIFIQAVEIADAPERERWLTSVCGADPELQRQVLQMLEADAGAGLSGNAIEIAAGMLPDHAIASGISHSRLGPYLVGGMVGMGGMGAVYEARDTRLDRKVALKVLSAGVAAEHEPLRRFRQEARAVSLLNHPNIVSIYDAEFSDGLCYIATEFVEGRTLRQMLASGPLNFADLVRIGVQVCSALEAAHQAGIVHRDIKPENIMVRGDGIVKVLDFGLAKLTESPLKLPAMETATGILAGTGPYMSPEQLLGQPAKPQSDLFSFGVVLFEAIAGSRPFAGPTPVATASCILHEEPKTLASLGARDVPADFDSLLIRLLEKDPGRRYASAAETRAALSSVESHAMLTSELRPALRQEGPGSQRRVGLKAGAEAALAGVACIALGAAMAYFFWNSATVPQPMGVQRITEVRSEAIYSNLTPDGKQLIYSSPDDGKWSIYLQRVGGRAVTNLTRDSGVDDTEPAISRDGAQIAFRSERDGGGIFAMETTGENPVRVTSRGYLPSWSPDGLSIVWCDATFVVPSSRGGASHLHITQLANGSIRDLKTGDAVQPAWSPHGFRIAYWGYKASGERDIATVAADGSADPVLVTNDAAVDWNPVWSSDGRFLYFISDRGGSMNLWRVSINERSGVTRGVPQPVVLPAGSIRSLSFSADGSLLAYSTSQGHSELYSVALDPLLGKVIGAPIPAAGHTHVIASFSISPDGSSIAYDTVGDIAENIWLERLDGADRRRLTFDAYRERVPEWSPDGSEILFFSNRSGVFNDYLVRSDGSGLRQITAFRDHGAQSAVWSPDRRRLLVVRQNEGLSVVDPWTARPVENAAILPGTNSPAGVLMHGDSRNNVYLGHATPNGLDEIVRVVWPPGRVELTGIRGRAPWWLPNSDQRFLFIRDSAIYLYDWSTHREQKILSVAPHRPYILRTTSDGRRLWFSQQIREGNIWMARMSANR